MSYMPKPKGERAAILEMEARLSMAAGGGRASPNVFRVPAMYKWINDPGPARRSRSRSHSTEPPGPAGRRSISTYDDFYESSRRSPSRATPLSPIPGRESRLSSMSTGSWFTSSLADLDSHWNGATIFGIDARHEKNRPPPVKINAEDDAKPLARTENRDSFQLLDRSELPPPQAVRRGILRDRVTTMRETCLRGQQTVAGVIQLPNANATYAHAQ